MRRLSPLLPIALLSGLLFVPSHASPEEASRAQVGSHAPDFRVDRLDVAQDKFSPAQMRGQVWLLNVWASWCTPCREELPTLKSLAEQVPIVGLNYKDTPQKGLAWLRQFGDPYRLSARDADGKVGVGYGIEGVPETFVIDKQGVVRFRHSGPVTPALVQERLLPLIRELRRG